ILSIQLHAGRDAADQLPRPTDYHGTPDHAAQPDYPVHRPCRVYAHSPCNLGRESGTPVLRLLFQERRHRQIQTPGLVPLQWRTRGGHDLAAHGSLRTEDGEDEVERLGRAATV